MRFGLGVYPGRMYCQASPSELTRYTLFRFRVVVPCLSAYPRSDSRVGKTGTRSSPSGGMPTDRSVKEAVTPGGRARPPEGIPKAWLFYCSCPEPGARPPEGEPGYRECWYEKRGQLVPRRGYRSGFKTAGNVSFSRFKVG